MRPSSSSLLLWACYFLILCLSGHAFSTRSTAADTSSAANQQHHQRMIPITVLSGFLGTGKTTLLQEILQNKQGLKIGVVVNDVASVNIDSKLIAGKSTTTKSTTAINDKNNAVALADGMVELQNGCA